MPHTEPPRHGQRMIGTAPTIFVGYNLQADYISVYMHTGHGYTQLEFTPERAMDVADAIYDFVGLRTFHRIGEAGDE